MKKYYDDSKIKEYKKLNMFNGWLLGLWIAEVVIHGTINVVELTVKILED